MRADLFVAKFFNISRNKASELLENNLVLIDNSFKKPSAIIDKSCECVLLDEIYVSRAAYKLKGFLDEFDMDLSNKDCLDVGSSTGGFTQILLSKNINSISCVDVGSNQLHQSLRENEKVKVYENTDIRDFNQGFFDLVVCDLSFISARLVINDLIRLSKDLIILLFKPQFEVGKNVKRNKNGVVKDEKAISKACLDFEKDMSKLGLILLKKAKSVLSGKEGNYEYFYAFKK